MATDGDAWQEFFEKFGKLLNEYNFMISEFTLGKSVDSRIKLYGFRSDGKRVYPVYEIPEDLSNLFEVKHE